MNNVILVGLGKMGKNHLRVLTESNEFNLVGIVDSHLGKSEIQGIKVFKNLNDICTDTFDCAVIATPTETHFEVAKSLLELNKQLLIEKPIASTIEDSNTLAKMAKDKDVSVFCGHVERSNPAVRKLKDVIEQGFIGKAIHFSFTRVGGYPQNVNKGNNVLLDLAVHDLDVLNYLQGTFNYKASVCHNTIIKEIPDTAEILLASDEGVSANIHVNWITPTKIRSLRVTGTKGVCFVDYMMQTCTLYGGNLLNKIPKNDFNYKELQMHYQNSDKIEFGVAKEEPLKIQLKEWSKALNNEEHGLANIHDASWAVELAEKSVKQS